MDSHKKVIERFGGIRGMARKLEHGSHTTVQGWWRRSIPVSRWPEVAAAAERHGIAFDINELLPETLRGAA
jgi:hypothetical protein